LPTNSNSFPLTIKSGIGGRRLEVEAESGATLRLAALSLKTKFMAGVACKAQMKMRLKQLIVFTVPSPSFVWADSFQIA
jgi:hypothetical protein